MEKTSQDRLFVIKDGLFGREKDVDAIVNVYKKARANESSHDKLILVRGPAGVGKTTLIVKALKKLVESDGGFFVSGKFDQHVGTEPYSAITSAFTDLIDTISASDEDSIATREKVAGTLGEDARMLIRMLPSLSNFVCEDADEPTDDSVNTEARNKKFMLVFQSLVRVLSVPEHPLVVFIDDLHWANESSLELLKALAIDPDNHSLLIIGAYRDNEVPAEHPLTSLITYLKRVEVGVAEIHIENLSSEAVNELICLTLDLEPELTWSLTDVLIRETGGNVFFVRQLLHSFHDEGLLYFDSVNARWCWDTLRKQERAIDVIGLLTRKLCKLPKELQSAVKIAAAIGGEIEPSVFDQVSSLALSTLDQVVELGGVLLKGPSGTYRFVHDRVQQAAYSMIPVENRPAFHLRIGKALWTATSTENFDDNLFLIVYHLNRGARLLKVKNEMYGVSKLNLRAGKEAMRSSAFASAEVYYDNGIDLLPREHWTEEYDLSLELYSSASEATFTRGKFSELDLFVDEVLENAITFNDRLRAYTVKVNALGSQGKILDAMKVGIEVLKHLGEWFPSRPRKVLIWRDLVLTRRKLRRRSESSLLHLPWMSDRDKLASLRILNLLFLYAYQGHPEFFPLITCRIVRLSLSHGACALTSVGFAAFALTLCGMLEEVHEGYRYGQLALAYLDRFKCKEYIPRVHLLVYAGVDHWTRPYRESVEPCRYAHRVGLESGDIEAGMIAACLVVFLLFYGGEPLKSLEAQTVMYRKRMLALNQTGSLDMTRSFLQMIHNFMGRSRNPLILSGEVMEQETEIADLIEKGNHTDLIGVYQFQSILAYYFGDFERALFMAEKSRGIIKTSMGHQAIVHHCFIEGLSAIAVSRTSKARKHVKLARRRIAKMNTYAEMSMANNGNRLALMEAEFAAANGKHEEAMVYYNKSIAMAGREGFLPEQALAMERAGQYAQRAELDPELQKRFFERAMLVYAEWGSLPKVDHVRSMFGADENVPS